MPTEQKPSLNEVLTKLESQFLPTYSPQQLELLKAPTREEKKQISTVKEDIQKLLNGDQLEEKKENWYKDLVYYIAKFTQFQREKQKQQGKEENFFLHDEQILALTRAVDHYQQKKGVVLEMKTGEGKSQVVIPVFLAWLGKRETDIHIHEVNPFLLNEAYTQFLEFARYLGIENQVGKLSLDNLKETEGKRFIFGLWHNFIHWYQFSFLGKAEKFPPNPLLVLDEIDQLLMDEALTPAIISESAKTEEFLESFLKKLREDLNQIERPAFEFEYQGMKITIDPKDYDSDLLKQDDFLRSLKILFELSPLAVYLEELNKQQLSDEKKAELLGEDLNLIIFSNIILGQLKKTNSNFVPDDQFKEVLKKAYKEHQPVFWFYDPEVNRNLISALLVSPGKDYIIKEGKIIPLAPTTGYQEVGKKFSPLMEIFLHLKHNLELPQSVELESDRLSTLEFYLRFKRIYGFTGTAATVARRLYEGYGLETTLISPHYPDNRDESFLFFSKQDVKLKAITETIFKSDKKNILIVVSDPEEARQLKKIAANHSDLEINILSAENEAEDWQYYQWISSFSESGKKKVLITVKMIGRGVDLRPDEQVRQNGFLLLAASPFEYQRSYFQLIGRVGRRGERGEVKTFISFDDPVFSILTERERKKLSEFFVEPQKNQKEIKKMIEISWQRKEDEITERFRNKKIFFWPIVNLRNYLEKGWSFPEVKERWLKEGVGRWEKEVKEDYVLLPATIEQQFKNFLRSNWIWAINYLEDYLRGVVQAGALGPLGQMSPPAVVGESYHKALTELFSQFLDEFLKEQKNFFDLQKLTDKIFQKKLPTPGVG